MFVRDNYSGSFLKLHYSCHFLLFTAFITDPDLRYSWLHIHPFRYTVGYAKRLNNFIEKVEIYTVITSYAQLVLK